MNQHPNEEQALYSPSAQTEAIYNVIALRSVVLFPHNETNLDIGRAESRDAVNDAYKEGKLVLLMTQKDAEEVRPERDTLYDIGVLAEIKKVITLPGLQGMRIMVRAVERVKVGNFTQETPFAKAQATSLSMAAYESGDIELQALRRTMLKQFEEYAQHTKRVNPEAVRTALELDDIEEQANVVANHITGSFAERYEVLAMPSLPEQLTGILSFFMKEVAFSELEARINDTVKKEIDKSQKEYFLREKIRAISDELGEGENKAAEVSELKERIAALTLTDAVREKALKEVNRLAKISPVSPEYGVTRNYLDWFVDLPWGITTTDELDMGKAEEILNADHYGLEKVKDRILEFLAVRHLKEDSKGPIVCLVGPPGVGKTSLAKSVARALNRAFVRLSLGGVRDEAEIRGHRRTYVGSMPGRIIQGLVTAKSSNPVFLLDEVDKMTNDFRGDPAAALLEVLDPEQNNTFSDHYMEVPFDLSKVLFLTTANSVHTIPRPLLDRMELIELSSYTEEEKLEIALRYLLPKQITEQGLQSSKIKFTDAVIKDIIRHHTRESGVRELERKIGSICRKAAREMLSGKDTPIRISKNNLVDYLGKPRYFHSLTEEHDEVGVATGMAWTSVGGEILQIEANIVKGKGNLLLTGQLGEVMKESAQMGLSYVRSISQELGLADDFYETIDIHIHIPEGAVPKDGPSAGVAMAITMISALTKTKVRKDVAMTGEMTLRGKVLPVGGIKEKVLAAHRAGSRVILLPKENSKDLEELPENVREALTFHFPNHIEDVRRIAFVQ